MLCFSKAGGLQQKALGINHRIALGTGGEESPAGKWELEWIRFRANDALIEITGWERSLISGKSALMTPSLALPQMSPLAWWIWMMAVIESGNNIARVQAGGDWVISHRHGLQISSGSHTTAISSTGSQLVHPILVFPHQLIP